MSAFSDPFREARNASGVLKCPFHGEEITMILRHEDVRRAATAEAPEPAGAALAESVTGLPSVPSQTSRSQRWIAPSNSCASKDSATSGFDIIEAT